VANGEPGTCVAFVVETTYTTLVVSKASELGDGLRGGRAQGKMIEAMGLNEETAQQLIQ
jgi:hypothetical protein